MARIKNTRPTVIYWLVDTRTNTPFYCGKTVEFPEIRLRNHKKDARKWPNRPLTARLNECDGCVRIEVVEVVPVDGDWVEREKRWIWILRGSFPGCVNVSDGGVGVPGLVHSPETRERLRNANIGKTISAETRAKIALASSRFRHTPESRAKIGAAHRGVKKSPESIEMRAAAIRGIKQSPEHVEKRIGPQRGKPGRKHTAETRAKMSEDRKGRKHTAEARAKMSASHLGRKYG